MIKKFFSRLKKSTELKIDEGDNNTDISVQENNEIELNESIEVIEKEEIVKIEEEIVKKDENKSDDIERVKEIEDENEETEICEEDSEEEDIQQEKQIDEEFILNAKIKRGKNIKVIDIYTYEEQVFKTHKECSRKLKIAEDYIIENLKFGYTDYLGESITYLSKELQVNDNSNYLESNKSPLEKFNYLHDKIFTAKISQNKREDILSNEKIEPIKMHYKFESIDYEYNEYFEKYKSIIKRGGKKKIELVDKNGEVIEIFKSLDECATYLNKDKQEISDMLKYKETKVGRREIRYSLRNI
ncbi:hypothetical protein [Romboutsia sp.]|uniref:hypothetical protein n=1 Tax=Romboutsia sp. TaxID=1965302 RepID=UPI003F3340B2